jgi:hypothetical protein
VLYPLSFCAQTVNDRSGKAHTATRSKRKSIL